MSILTKEQFFNSLKTYIGDDASDESVKILEDFTDTYNALEKTSVGDGTDWKKKYLDNDKAWKERYQKRFFSSPVENNADDYEEAPKTDETITVNDLFK